MSLDHDNTYVISLPVDAVTLLEDRAHVVRRGRVQLEGGAARIVIEGASPVIVDKTLSARVVDGPAEVVDVRVRRRRVLPDPGEVLARLDAELETRSREEDRLEADEEIVSAYRERLDQAVKMRLSEMAEDATWGRHDSTASERQLGSLHEAERERSEQLVGVRDDLRRLRKQISRLRQHRNSVDRPDARYETRILVDLAVAGGHELELEVSYLVPCACWRPAHRARLTLGETPKVLFECEASVWQNTGESWQDVELSFSTERASLGADPPDLEPDELRVQRTGKAVDVETREDRVHRAGLGAAMQEVPGIDDGGEARKLQAEHRAHVPSDGRPYRVPVFRFESEAVAERVCLPEVVPAIILRTEQDNAASLPLLAGPVDLVRDSGPAGRTTLPFVAAGERFELGWGPDVELRVHREAEELAAESRMLSNWSAVKTRVRVRLSNLGPAEREVLVTERIPVSEVEKVQVEVEDDKTTPEVGGKPARPDQDGMMRWKMQLPPYGHEDIELGWVLRKHSDVSGV